MADPIVRRFEGKVAIVTGASGGIGSAIVHRLAAEGAKVVLVNRDPETAEAVAKAVREHAPGAEVLNAAPCDVSKEADVTGAVKTTLDAFGRLDVVVNNAGAMHFKPIEELAAEDWARTLDVDLLGAFYFTKQAFLHMSEGGAVVNISSIHAVMTSPTVAPYASSKGALVSFTHAAAIEGKPKRIRVNAILPGAIDTPMLWENPNVKSGAEKIDPKDVGRPEDIAAAVAFLAADEAAFVNGAALNVDGGRLAHL